MKTVLHSLLIVILLAITAFGQKSNVSMQSEQIFMNSHLHGKVQVADSLDYATGNPKLYNTTGNTQSYVAGTNSFDDLGKYQRFDLTGTNFLTGTYMLLAGVIIRPANSPDSIDLVIRSASDTVPGTLIYSKKVSTASFVNGTGWTSFSFGSPVVTTGSFFVGLEWTTTYSNANSDRFAVATDSAGSTNGNNAHRAWELWSDGTLAAMDDAWTGFDCDLWIGVVFDNSLPVELTSFTSKVSDKNVELTWVTASETNNSGFEIQKKTANGSYVTIGYKQGNGTTTQSTSYRFTDKNVQTGSYTYKLKQMNFDGTFEFSKEINVEVNNLPTQFSVSQNYPNPFNPSTKIKYALPSESNVKLTIYNALGQKVSELLNSVQAPGFYEMNFDAANLSSGLYFYNIEANALDGSGNFNQVKKMMLVR